MNANLIADHSTTFALPAGERLTVSLAASRTAIVERYLGDQLQTPPDSLVASQTKHFGEYEVDSKFRVTCLTGSLSIATAVNTGQTVVRATQTNDSAAAGEIGEYKEVTVTLANAVPLTTATPANIASMTLTPGDWDVIGSILLHPAASTVVDHATSGISEVSDTIGGIGTYDVDVYGVTTTVDFSKHTPITRVSEAVDTPVYRVTDATFTVSTLSAYGQMRARRIR